MTAAALNAYYEALDGNVSGFPVYKLTVPEDEKGNFVLLSIEGGADVDNKGRRIEEVVIIVDIVANYRNDASQAALETADGLIKDIICPNPGGNSLTGSGIEIRNVRRENYAYTVEGGGVDMVYRKISRYTNRIVEIVSGS